MKKVCVTVFSLFVSAFAWSDVPDTANFPENDNSFSVNATGVLNSQPQFEIANPDPALVVDVRRKVGFDDKGLPKQDNFFGPYDQYDGMPRYHVYPRVDNMPGIALDPAVDAKILKVYPEVGIGLLGPQLPHQNNKHLPFKK